MTTNRFVIKLLTGVLVYVGLCAFLIWRRADTAMTITILCAIPVLALALWPSRDAHGMYFARMQAPPAPALLVIDVQEGIDDPRHGRRNNPGAEKNIARLLSAWREAGQPVIHVRHDAVDPDSVLRPGLPGNAIKPEAMPVRDEPLFAKSVNSAFIGTTLEGHLREHGIDRLVIVGHTTDHCISTTARMAANLGFTVTVVADATATHERIGPDGVHHDAEVMHQLALASLHEEFAAIRTTSEVLTAS